MIDGVVTAAAGAINPTLRSREADGIGHSRGRLWNRPYRWSMT